MTAVLHRNKPVRQNLHTPPDQSQRLPALTKMHQTSQSKQAGLEETRVVSSSGAGLGTQSALCPWTKVKPEDTLQSTFRTHAG